MIRHKLPFVLSLSKDSLRAQCSCFDKLSTNGAGEAVE